jgi:hypothetical protein
MSALRGLGGLVVSMLASGTRVRGFKPDRNRKNPQHAFLWKGNKSVGPVSQICGRLKNTCDYVEVESRAKFCRPFIARAFLLPGSAEGHYARGAAWVPPGVERGN